MSSGLIRGTFAGDTFIAFPGTPSDSLVISYGVTSIKLSTLGLDSNNTIKTQKRTSPGGAWADQTTYNSDQTNTAVTAAYGEEWRVIVVTQQAANVTHYRLSQES